MNSPVYRLLLQTSMWAFQVFLKHNFKTGYVLENFESLLHVGSMIVCFAGALYCAGLERFPGNLFVPVLV